MGYVPLARTNRQEAVLSSSRVTPRSARRRFVTGLTSITLPVALLLTACGGDDPTPTTVAAATDTTESDGGSEHAGDDSTGDNAGDGAPAGDTGSIDGSGQAAEVGEIDDVGDLAEAIGGEELTDAIDALGIETRVSILASQLGGTYEVTSDTTATLILDGDVGVDGIMACIVSSAISSPGDVITARFPNGEVVCD